MDSAFLMQNEPNSGGRGRDIERVAMPEAGTETSSASQDRAAQNAKQRGGATGC
jgi:hypothetical protein